MVRSMQQLSAGWVEGENSLSSTVGNASSAVLPYFTLVSAKQPVLPVLLKIVIQNLQAYCKQSYPTGSRS